MSEDITTPIPEPIGSYILSHKKIIGVITSGGYYYHYADVCTLMKEHAEREVIAEREANKKEVHTLIDLVSDREKKLNDLSQLFENLVKHVDKVPQSVRAMDAHAGAWVNEFANILNKIQETNDRTFLGFLKSTKPVPNADKLQRVPD